MAKGKGSTTNEASERRPVASSPPSSKSTNHPEAQATKSITLSSALALLILTTAVLIPIYPEVFGSLNLLGSADFIKLKWQQFQGTTVAPDDKGVQAPEDEACVALTHWLPDITYLPGTVGYANQWRAHWSEQAQNALPSCVARPRDADEVSQVVTVLKNLYDLPFLARARGTGAVVDNNIRFVVRSGGHSVEIGQSSIVGGALIDLALLNSIDLADDHESVSIGPGARWGEVFEKLERDGLVTAGGRNARVGVGGLSLGGGLSWISPQVGMVQDNVLEYEVVLANGTVVVATENRYADLWRALKGGSGNFGIVTRFKARTFPATKVWGGYVYYYTTKAIAEKLIDALYDFGQPQNFDPYAATPILAFASLNVFGFDVKASCTHILYNKPQAWPSVWSKFKSVFYIWSAAKVRTYASAAEELVGVAAYGKQQHQATITIKLDLDTIRGFYDLYERSWDKVRHVKGVLWGVVFQPLTPAMMHRGSANSLGLESRNSTESLLIVLVSCSWTDATQDSLMYQVIRELVASMEVHAMLRNTLDRYIYLNYAASWQNVFTSYGEDSLKFLQSVSKKYDEHGFWQFARAGGFKLGLERPGSAAYPEYERPSVWDPPVHTPPAHVHGAGAHHDHHHHHEH